MEFESNVKQMKAAANDQEGKEVRPEVLAFLCRAKRISDTDMLIMRACQNFTPIPLGIIIDNHMEPAYRQAGY